MGGGNSRAGEATSSSLQPKGASRPGSQKPRRAAVPDPFLPGKLEDDKARLLAEAKAGLEVVRKDNQQLVAALAESSAVLVAFAERRAEAQGGVAALRAAAATAAAAAAPPEAQTEAEEGGVTQGGGGGGPPVPLRRGASLLAPRKRMRRLWKVAHSFGGSLQLAGRRSATSSSSHKDCWPPRAGWTLSCPSSRLGAASSHKMAGRHRVPRAG